MLRPVEELEGAAKCFGDSRASQFFDVQLRLAAPILRLIPSQWEASFYTAAPNARAPAIGSCPNAITPAGFYCCLSGGTSGPTFNDAGPPICNDWTAPNHNRTLEARAATFEARQHAFDVSGRRFDVPAHTFDARADRFEAQADTFDVSGRRCLPRRILSMSGSNV